MNKSELIAVIAIDADVTRAVAERAVNAFTNAVTEELKHAGSVELVGFGKFEVSQRAARNGRNPQTGETLQIAAAQVPKFKPGKKLKDAVNGK